MVLGTQFILIMLTSPHKDGNIRLCGAKLTGYEVRTETSRTVDHFKLVMTAGDLAY